MIKILNKYNKLPDVLKASLWFTFAIILQKGLTSLTTPIITRMLTMEDYGIYSLYQSWYSVFLIICTFNLSGSIFNTMLLDHDKDKDGVSNSIVFFEWTITIIVFCGYLLISLFFNLPLGISKFESIIIFLQIICFIPQSIWIAKMKFINEYKKCSFIILVQSCVQVLTVVLSLIISGGSLDALLISVIVVQALFSAIVFIPMFTMKPLIFLYDYWKYALIVGAPLLVHYLAQSVLSQSDKLVINYFFGEEKTALYSLAHSLAFILQILISAVNSAYMPWLYKKIKGQDSEGVNKSGVIILVGLSCLIILISLFAPEIIWLFGGSDYLLGKTLIPPLSSSIIVLLVYNYFSSIEFVYGETKVAALATVFAAVINIILNIIFIPFVGYEAAAYTTLFSYIVMLIVHYFYSKKVQKKYNNTKVFFSGRIIFLIMSIFILMNLSVTFVYFSNFIRCCVIVVFLILACSLFFRYKNMLIDLKRK